LPSDDARLQRRYDQLVQEHLAPLQRIATGLRVLPTTAQPFAAAQAAWRFYANPRVRLPQLARPLIDTARVAVGDDCHDYALLIHDWSELHYRYHNSKTDRIDLTGSDDPGYELMTALVISDRSGAPIAPVCMQLRNSEGLYSSRSTRRLPSPSPLDGLQPVMRYVHRLQLGKPLVHIIDAQADSVAHFRRWHRQGRLFLVRADAQRVVRHDGRERKLPEVVAELHRSGAFRFSREVLYHGQKARQFVAATTVTLYRPARPRRGGRRAKVPRPLVHGPALHLRLVVSEVRAADGTLLATWLLLTNLPEAVPAERVALWYYWRWRVESYFKLLKGAGLQLEHWQQETAAALAKRLLVASMACAVVWQVARDESPEAAEFRRLLVSLSGRLMRRGKRFTEPALLAGLWSLLSAIWLLDHYTPEELRRIAQYVLPYRVPLERPPEGPV